MSHSPGMDDAEDSPRIRAVERSVVSTHGQRQRALDFVATEEPLELRVAGVPVSVLMRTPGDDLDLGTGFAVTERIFERPEDLARVHHCTQTDSENVLQLVPQPGVSFDLERIQRLFYASSSCGVCGKRTIARAVQTAGPVIRRLSLREEVLRALPERLLASQPTFALTGGLHAAALATPEGDLMLVREDVGRHNAVDKVVGAAIRQGLDPSAFVLVVSGRCAFEIVQKALSVGIGAIVAVGAPTSLAVELAQQGHMALFAFVSNERLCIYSGEDFIDE